MISKLFQNNFISHVTTALILRVPTTLQCTMVVCFRLLVGVLWRLSTQQFSVYSCAYCLSSSVHKSTLVSGFGNVIITVTIVTAVRRSVQDT